jgi:hypothetical protein
MTAPSGIKPIPFPPLSHRIMQQTREIIYCFKRISHITCCVSCPLFLLFCHVMINNMDEPEEF